MHGSWLHPRPRRIGNFTDSIDLFRGNSVQISFTIKLVVNWKSNFAPRCELGFGRTPSAWKTTLLVKPLDHHRIQNGTISIYSINSVKNQDIAVSEFDSMSCFLSPKKDSRILVWIIVAVLFFSLVMHLLELLNRLVTEWSVKILILVMQRKEFWPATNLYSVYFWVNTNDPRNRS